MLSYLPLSENNLEEAITLVKSVFVNDFNNQDSPEEAFKASLDRSKHQNFIYKHNLNILKYFVAVDESKNKIVGVTGWYTRDIDPLGIIWLGWYCVDKEERGKGVGKEILDWTIHQTKLAGYKIIKLYTSTDPNEAIAQELYEKMGFKIVGEELKGEEIYKTLYRERIL